MPFYQCLVPAGSLDADTRSELAEAITDVHTSLTDAPRGFVNVLFVEYDPEAYFTAGKPNRCTVINGTIRAGRDHKVRTELLTKLSEAWNSLTGQDPTTLIIGLNEVDPTSVMEAGVILPAPGDEQAWLELNSAKLGEQLSAR
ncbi:MULTISPECIES: tautomerase family protein [unclassified Nocardia]|uniref:tautomerase family protein n=1 Tax=unclassified Nocardia TaxID=2637762 RepID=UPI001CE4AF31|nr:MULTISPECIES: tautomerase family protein [unclassified Nocardia]